MKGTKIFFILFILSIAVVFISCAEPVGSLLYSVDYIRAEPNKILYGQKDWFKPADPREGVKVYGVYGGVEEEIDINNVKIKIIEDPLSTPNEIIINDNQEGCFLENKGPKKVVITYRDKEARYDIAVGEPGIGNIGWGDGGTGINIHYWD